MLHAVHADECESADSNESFESIIKAKCEPKEYDQMKEQILDSGKSTATNSFDLLKIDAHLGREVTMVIIGHSLTLKLPLIVS